MTTSPPIAFDAEKETLVLDAVERFVDREIKPVAQRLEHADEWPADIVAGMREMGLFGCIIREEYGGLGLSASTYAKVVERIARVWMSVSGIINSHLIMAACVQRNGTEAQRQRFLPRFASGELRGGLALTEPDCGTDLQAVRTGPGATATITSSMGPRPGYPTASMARSLPCWARPILRPSRATAA